MEQLTLTNGTYRTEPRPLGLISRLLPSATFYPREFWVIFSASRLAKRGRYGTKEWCGSSLATLRALEASGVKVEVTGIDNFRKLDTPCVFIGNHMSTLETFVLPVLISTFRESTFVVKQSLVEYPIFKYVMRSRNPVTVGRSNPREDLKAVLDGGTERLQTGTSIVIFPQTTRTHLFEPEQFNTIGVKLAKKAGVPVVPIALKTDAWGTGSLFKDYGKIHPERPVHICFGEAMQIKDRGNEEHAAIIQFIGGKLKEWEKQDGR